MGESAADHRPLHVVVLPLMSPGHMIPAIDIAALLAGRGVATTVVTTAGNEPFARPSIDRLNSRLPLPIALRLLPFPPSALLRQAGAENLSAIPSSAHPQLMAAVQTLEAPLSLLLRDLAPDCILSDAMFNWTTAAAAALGVPRLVFYGPGVFPQLVQERLLGLVVTGGSGPFVLNDLPDPIEIRRSELSEMLDFPDFLAELRRVEEASFGVVFNSFHRLEPAYADLYRSKPGRRSWCIGPVSLPNPVHPSNPELDRRLTWLDSKPPRSVVYVCFGSLCEFTAGELAEIAFGLRDSGHAFVWVVKRGGGVDAGEEWMPEGFEESGQGLVIKGWAPQVEILGHVAVGGFVTHCGWNSTIEAVAAGVPMATWPLKYEQFLNEKLVTEVLRVGVRVRVRTTAAKEGVRREEVAAAVRRLMSGGEEAEGMRLRAAEYAAAARAAVADCGSSHDDLSRLIEEISACRVETSRTGQLPSNLS